MSWLDISLDEPCPRCKGTVYWGIYTMGGDHRHCRMCWRQIPEAEQKAILDAIYEPIRQAAREARAEAKDQRDPYTMAKMTCGRCERVIHPGESCRFCAGEPARTEQEVLDAPYEAIARVAYEANRIHSRTLGDYNMGAWDGLTRADKLFRIAGVKWRLQNLHLDARQVHEHWVKAMKEDGWTLGEKKSTRNKTHPCLVPWDELPPDQQRKDFLFVAIVSALGTPINPEA